MENYRYEIVLKHSLNEDNKNVIVQLYQPILGLTATQVYLTLVEEFKLMQKMPKSVFSEQELSKFLGLSISDLETSLNKLGGMDLIKTFENKKTKTLTYVIQRPLDPKEFFNNVLFDDVLKQRLGVERYEMVKVFYLSDAAFNNNNEVVETTANFEQAFSSEFQSFKSRDLNQGAVVINNDLVDFSAIQNKMEELGMDKAALTEKAKEVILANLNSVTFSDDELLEVIKEAYDFDQYQINLDNLKILLKGLVVKKLEAQSDELTETKVREMEEHDAEEYASLLQEQPCDRTTKNIIKNLRQRIFGFKKPKNDGVINCLLEYSYWKNDTKIVGNYLYKIADSIVEKGITTTKTVMEYLRNAARYTKSKVTSAAHKVGHAFSRVKESISDFAHNTAEELRKRKEDNTKSLEWLRAEVNN